MALVPGEPHALPLFAVDGVVHHAAVLPVERLAAHVDREVWEPEVARVAAGRGQLFLVFVSELFVDLVTAQQVSDDDLGLARDSFAARGAVDELSSAIPERAGLR